MELPPVASELDPGDSEEAALPDLDLLLPSAAPAGDKPAPNPGGWSGEHDTAVLHQSPPWLAPPAAAAAAGWIISW
jgi:hypothetical protein